MRGRKPKPAEIRLIEGNAGKRPIVATAALPGEPIMPADFDAEHALLWVETLADMAGLGVLGRENGAAIEIYCRALIRMRNAERHVAEHGPVVPAPRTGVPMHNPYLAVANQAAATVMKLASELGLTPVGRVRVGAAKAEPAGAGSKFAGLFGGDGSE